VRTPFRRPSNPKPKWRHDQWTLHHIYEKVKMNAARVRIVLALKYLKAGISFTQVCKLVGESNKTLAGWVRQYNRNGLQAVLALQLPIPQHARTRLERHLKEHPEVWVQLVRLREDDDFEIYGEEIGVEGYALKNWVLERQLTGK
jgi:hypothetical protein